MYTAKKYEHLLGTLGFSDMLLKNHFTLYEGYVMSTNKVLELIAAKEIGTPEHSELSRRLGWEWNGMRMHELYFGNMTKGGKEMTAGALKTKIEKTYGTVEKWKESFIGTGKMRGIGWVVLAYDKESDELFSTWVNEHDVGHLVSTTPLLVMDVFEHAFMIDYGLKRAEYITAFMNSIDWSVVEARFA